MNTQEKYEQLVKELESTGNYKVLRKLTKRSINKSEYSPDNSVGVILDIETTGLDPNTNEIIELGLIKFNFSEDGTIKNIIDEFQCLNQPSISIPKEITNITDLTDEMVKGKEIPENSVIEFVRDASIIIAHNAIFDRKFCEKKWKVFAQKSWACSLKEVQWRKEGFVSSSIEQLLQKVGYFHEGHRAINDCYALLEILSHKLSSSNETVLKTIIDCSKKPTIRIWIENLSFANREIIKERGYRWSNGSDKIPKAWWTDIDSEMLEEEIYFLKNQISSKNEIIFSKELSSLDRYSEREFLL